MDRPAPQTTDQWAALERHAAILGPRHLRDLFAEDPARVDSLTFDMSEWRIDVSKQRVTTETLDLLVDLAEATGVDAQRQAMWNGDRINRTEDRAVLHMALRADEPDVFVTDGHNVVPDVLSTRASMTSFADDVRAGRRTGHTGERLETVINIGIGGSDLGPAMISRSLVDPASRVLDVRFVSNVDPSDLADALCDARPESTLFVIVSKTFTTVETMDNAGRARQWLASSLGDDAVSAHFVAASSAVERAGAFGIEPENVFGFWDWVGGRYSVWSAVGLSLMLAVGPDAFDEMLGGARAVDHHFAGAEPRSNVPLMAALIGIWNRNFLGLDAHCVIPYSQRLGRLPAYLQQLDMESNGKRVRMDGSTVGADTGPLIWGEPGTNGQHAFFQLLHQGTTVVPVDFIGASCAQSGFDPASHRTLVANMLAQSSALAFGKTTDELAAEGCPPELLPHRTFPGNRPSSTLLTTALTPRSLGELLAFYEHRTFAQGAVWGIDSFDQWGVELGKALAGSIVAALDPSDTATGALPDPSTASLVAAVRAAQASRPGAGPGA